MTSPKEDPAREVSERELLAAVDGRRDLVGDALRDALADDDDLGAALDALRDERDALSVALKRAQPELGGLDADDVSELVARAMAKADAPDEVRISPRGLGWGALAGGLAVVSSAVAWVALQGSPTAPLSQVSQSLRLLWSLGATLDRVVAMLPGAWTTVAAVAFVIGTGLLWGLKAIEHGKRIVLPAAGALLCVWTLGAAQAHAYDVEGPWPAPDPLVEVDVVAQPLPAALEAATRSCGLGLVYGLDDTRLVTLHAHGVPLREVLDAMLGPSAAVVRFTGHMLVIEPRASSVGATAEPAPANASPSAPVVTQPVAAAAPLATAPVPGVRLEDVLTFGGDAHVPAGRDVREVVTMGGDARVEGRAFGNVVTMGGDADVAGVVVGDVVTMGGDIRIRPSGVVHGQLQSMGGDVVREDGGASVSSGSFAFPGAIPPAAMAVPRHEDGEGAGFFALVVQTAEAGLRYALLFLGALLFAFFAPERFGRLHQAVRRAPLRSIAGGAVGMIAGSLLTLVLCITIIGLPVAFVLVVSAFVAACAGLATVAHLIGQALPLRALEDKPVLRLGAGILALFLVTRVPFFGWLAFLLALAIGLGAVLLTRFGRNDVAVDP
jgi:hypothetical protein